ncbi:trifunctional hydroxymethylpyrimidine kinase/phosphomethylpyrimidine kinase/thiaminase [Cryomyces antarcticus]|uniref:Trifunctional hydroxymethylpyrimidine kinase/phosphomethylpyrimidine kinase/thiaminase n=1 Tax=Cryomyces antarcticus TaxID=329879 RepID=A0ABR0M6K7_9PEZI|nr:trifunctional hydroxymethylpyrimidine kinase/phosphomethylpyrimidine kinase/thiaminase [Cryomyces antarcticus]
MWKLESGQAKTWGKGAVPSTIFTPPILCLSLRELITPPTYLKADCDNSKRFIEYLLEREDVKEAWLEHTEHAFVAGLADGTLPLETFKYYLIQDYLYLVSHNTKLSGTDVDIRQFHALTTRKSASIVTHINEEVKLHLKYCEEFGVSKEEIESTQESQACTAYTRYVLDIGHSEDWLALQISMLPCLIGYGEIARRLHNDPNTEREGNRYWQWILNYVADDYTEAVRVGSDLVEKHAVRQSPNRIEELVRIFVHATKMETGFWDMGMEGNV